MRCLILFWSLAQCCLLDPLYWNVSSRLELLLLDDDPVLEEPDCRFCEGSLLNGLLRLRLKLDEYIFID